MTDTQSSSVTEDMVNTACGIYEHVYIDDDKSMHEAMRAALTAVLGVAQPSSGTTQALAEELREYTAMKYAGDCKCGKCQLVPRALVERIYHTLNSISSDTAIVWSDASAALRHIARRLREKTILPYDIESLERIAAALLNLAEPH